ncbi:MAG: cytochrome oxidase subunit III [Bacteroidia bacterium]|jgi:cytochrome c oxidase subunit 3|nr:cytochrome oxidase subunit III [Bacteroidia bacterium]
MNATIPDITAERADNEETLAVQSTEKSHKLLLWLGLVSIAMMFAGLTSGYLVRRETGSWVHFEMPVQFWFSTAVMLISSIAMNMATAFAKRGNFAILPKAILVTFVLGTVFIICQFMGWQALVKANIYVMGSASSASGSYLYIISGLHLAHLLGGLIALLVVYFRAVRRQYTAGNYSGLKICAIYWHFLDGLWLYLFLFMLLAR